MATRRHVAWSERRGQVSELVARHEQSGRSYRALALERGLPLPALYVWLKRLRDEHASAPARSSTRRATFVELTPVAAEAPRLDGSGLEVVVPSGLRIRIGTGFDGDALRRLLATLGA